jgi:hypothetical protein
MVTRRSISFTLVLALAGVLLLLQSSFVAAKGGSTILEWQTMVGVPQAFTGQTNKALIRDVPGGGIQWRLDLGKGELSRNGHLEIKVRGLVLAAGANAGSNPVGVFRGLVSCLNDSATPAVVNVSTGDFTATTGPASAGGGNADIEADLNLPSPCIAPIVFVTSGGGAWFAATGG